MPLYDPSTDPVLVQRPWLVHARDVYLAAPFFKEEQVKECENAEGLLEHLKFSFFTPRLECRYKPGDHPVVAARAFYLNKFHIERAKFVYAILLWPDAGTSWELGYAYARDTPVLARVSRKMLTNLMLRAAATKFTISPRTSLGALSLDKERGKNLRQAIQMLPEAPLEGEME